MQGEKRENIEDSHDPFTPTKISLKKSVSFESTTTNNTIDPFDAFVASRSPIPTSKQFKPLDDDPFDFSVYLCICIPISI